MSNELAACIPLSDRVVVKRDAVRKQTQGGILLTNGEKRITGVVVSVGPGGYQHGNRVHLDPRIQPGVRVILTGWAGMELQDGVAPTEDDDYLIVRADDIQAVMPN